MMSTMRGAPAASASTGQKFTSTVHAPSRVSRRSLVVSAAFAGRSYAQVRAHRDGTEEQPAIAVPLTTSTRLKDTSHLCLAHPPAHAPSTPPLLHHLSPLTQQPNNRTPRPENVEGAFYVDHTCIDCDTCRMMAPGGKAGTPARTSVWSVSVLMRPGCVG